MILNETPQIHEECLEECDMEHEACKFEQDSKKQCRDILAVCERNCDFDYES